MFGVKKEILERLRKEYPLGTRVELIQMEDAQAPPVGTRGTVSCVDDIGTIHVDWDTGSSLGIAYGEDRCRKIEEIRVTCYGKTTIWTNREDARLFFLEAMTMSEGAEKDRYSKIYVELIKGKTVCSDE